MNLMTESVMGDWDEILSPSSSTKGQFTEPGNVPANADKPADAFVEERELDVSVGIFAVEEVRTLMLGVLNEDPVETYAASMIQTWDESIEDMEFNGVEPDGETSSVEPDGGDDALYRSGINAVEVDTETGD